jgi:hypothetical protein
MYDLYAFIPYLYCGKNAMHMYDKLLSYEYLLISLPCGEAIMKFMAEKLP